MNNINDEQRWVYPHWHPWFPQNQHNRFMPFPGRPMGDESYRHATVLSFLGRGPKGATGATFTYEMMTEDDKQDLVRHMAGATGSIEDFSTTKSETVASDSSVVFPGMDVSGGDIVFVFVNGILLQNTDPNNPAYIASGDSITFKSGVEYHGLPNEFFVRILRFNVATTELENNNESQEDPEE